MSSRVFNKIPLYTKEEERNFPRSLPLVLPTNYSFDFATHKLSRREEKPQDGGVLGFQLVPKALELLSRISKPVAVLSMCGPFRSGKSYFLSRMLGTQETFKLGHTMEACTRGIWMASCVLECEEFSLVLLDTEGIDAPDKTDASVTKLVVLTMLLSSMFVYNSKKVPRGKDLRRMSCLTSVSRMVGGENSIDVPTQRTLTLPDFVWVLRDVDVLPANAEECETSLTEHVKQILESNTCGVGSILKLFPSFHCLTLPPPSSNAKVLSEITNNLSSLSDEFNADLTSAVQHMLDEIRVKVVHDSGKTCDGSLLACLIEQHFKWMDHPDNDIPTIRKSWLMAVELKLKRVAESLADDYKKSMTERLTDELPIKEGGTGENLMNIHREVLVKKRLMFLEALVACLPQSEEFSDFESGLVRYFDKIICEEENGKVVGGFLVDFVQENTAASEKYCTSVYNNHYKRIVEVKLRNALSEQVPSSIADELGRFKKEYYSQAIGPAVDDVYDHLREESVDLENHLKLIPGPVIFLKIVGLDSDRVKLKWSCPKINPDSVVEYRVLIKAKSELWNEVLIRKKCSVLVTGLESSSWYSVSVVAASEKYTGNDASLVKFRTRISPTAQKALNAAAIVASPVVYPCMASYVGASCIAHGLREKSSEKFFIGALTLALVPPATLTASIPVVGSLYSHRLFATLNKARTGDVEDPDAENADAEVEPPPPATRRVSAALSDSDSGDHSAYEIDSEHYRDLEESSEDEKQDPASA